MYFATIWTGLKALIDLSGNYFTTNTFQIRTTLNRMDFKFVSHGLWSEKQNVLLHNTCIKRISDFDK